MKRKGEIMKGVLPKESHEFVMNFCEELRKRMRVLGPKPKLLSVLMTIDQYQNYLVGVPPGNVDIPTPERRDTLPVHDSEEESGI
jgi:hypothetical protein